MGSCLSHMHMHWRTILGIPFDFPMTSGLEVDSKGFFNGDWLSRSSSVRAIKKQVKKCND